MPEQKQCRPGLRWLIVAALACAAGLGLKGLGTSFRTSRTPPPAAPDPQQISQPAGPESASGEDSELKPVGPGESQYTPRLARVVQTVARATSTVLTEPRIEPTPYTRQLVS